MLQFTATLKQFEEKGEKTGWTYIEIPAEITRQLKPGNKKAFRVKGFLDQYFFNLVSLIPMGGGEFIMAINAGMRKEIKKSKGAMVQVQLEVDTTEIKLPADLLECLADEPDALANFKKLPPSHQRYYANWINSAKTEPTKTKRLAQTISALAKGLSFSAMLHKAKKENEAG